MLDVTTKGIQKAEQTQLQAIIAELEQQGVSVGLMVKSLDREAQTAVLVAHDADRLMTPASNTKLVTSSSALRLLGADYRYKTEIYVTGAVASDGSVQGDLIVKGFGDPSIHTDGLLKVHDGLTVEQIAAAIRETGITSVLGNLIVDDCYFDRQRRGEGWSWEYESEYYSAQTSALSVNRGMVRIDFHVDGQIGDAPRLVLTPQTAYVQLHNVAKVVGADEPQTLMFERESGSNLIRVSGQLPITAEADFARISVHEPALYLGTLLKEQLEAGVLFSPTSQVIMGNVPLHSEKLLELWSGPLKAMITQLNKSSDNHYAEMLLKTLGSVKKGEGSSAAGLEVVCETMKELGVPSTFKFYDGSGLSRYNLISPKHLVTLLELMTKEPEYGALYESLPIAGVDGTLASRLQDGSGYANVRAKTGTLLAVSGLSGYLTTARQEKCVFSIMLNGYTGDTDDLKVFEDRIVTQLLAI